MSNIYHAQPTPKAWHLRRFGPLGWYQGEDWRHVPRIQWGQRGMYVRVFWRVFWREVERCG